MLRATTERVPRTWLRRFAADEQTYQVWHLARLVQDGFGRQWSLVRLGGNVSAYRRGAAPRSCSLS
jgi:hypothetical protein